MAKSRKIRLLMLAVVLLTLVVVGRLTGITDQLRSDAMRDWVASAGGWGALLFLVLFAIGQLLQVPGLLFVAAAILVYGRLTGGLLGLLGGVVAVTVSFILVRGVGGKALGEIDRPLLKTLLGKIDQQPIRAVILMRLVFIMWPPVNYALALTNLRLRDYVIGSAIGLTPVIAVAAIFFDWLFG